MLDEKDIEIIKQMNLESEQRMMVMMESYFGPRFDALDDKLGLVIQAKASMEVAEDLNDRVTVLESAVQKNTEDIAQLRQAQ